MPKMNNNSQACQYRKVPNLVYDNNSSRCIGGSTNEKEIGDRHEKQIGKNK